jgi:hypothetical protein
MNALHVSTDDALRFASISGVGDPDSKAIGLQFHHSSTAKISNRHWEPGIAIATSSSIPIGADSSPAFGLQRISNASLPEPPTVALS